MVDKSKKILVTGGSGFVGSYVIRLLLHYGYDNICTITRNKNNIPLIADLSNKVEIQECDILDLFTLDEITSKCDYIIHTAALVSFKPRDKKQMMKINVDGTSNIVNLAMEHKIKKLIHISSIASLGRNGQSDYYDENSKWEETKYNSDYSTSKYYAEMEVWRGIAEGLNAAILNPSMILGAGIWKNGTSEFFTRVDRGLKYYPVGSNGFVDVRDVAAMSIQLLESDISGERFICNSENISLKSLFSQIANDLNLKAPSIKINPGLIKIVSHLLDLYNTIIGGNTNLSSQSLKNASIDSKYNNSKSLDKLNYKYIPVYSTIEETAKCYLESKESGTQFGLLQIKKERS